MSNKAFRAVTISQASSAAGAIVGLATGGPAGTLIAAPATAIASWFLGRLISPVEESRVFEMFSAAAEKLHELEGLRFDRRSDDFFTSNGGYGSDFQEVVEAVLKATVDDHEQRKAPILGVLLANIAQGKDCALIGRSDATKLIQLVRTLTYRQLAILAIVNDARLIETDRRFRHRLPANRDTLVEDIQLSNMVALEELIELKERGLVQMSNSEYAFTIAVGLSIPLYQQAELFRIDPRFLDQIRTELT